MSIYTYYVYVYGRWKLCLLVPRGSIFQNIGGIQLRNDVFLWCCFCRTGLCSSMLAAAESVICRVKEAPHMRYLDGRVLMKGPVEEHEMGEILVSSGTWHFENGRSWHFEPSYGTYLFLPPSGLQSPHHSNPGFQRITASLSPVSAEANWIYPNLSYRKWKGQAPHYSKECIFQSSQTTCGEQKPKPKSAWRFWQALQLWPFWTKGIAISQQVIARRQSTLLGVQVSGSFEVESFGESLGYHSGHVRMLSLSFYRTVVGTLKVWLFPRSAGTGLAPFFGFLQERDALRKQGGLLPDCWTCWTHRKWRSCESEIVNRSIQKGENMGLDWISRRFIYTWKTWHNHDTHPCHRPPHRHCTSLLRMSKWGGLPSQVATGDAGTAAVGRT